ncbi:MAG: ORF6N domain-containing protein [Bacteroidales bacterium]|nr:ORF6N domain-containing protein [Bacteroidales bacterium]
MSSDLVPATATNIESIKERIFEIRGQRVMMDCDPVELYCVETKQLNEAVKRNINRFPDGFISVLTEEEWLRLRSQFATSNTRSQSLHQVHTQETYRLQDTKERKIENVK